MDVSMETGNDFNGGDFSTTHRECCAHVILGGRAFSSLKGTFESPVSATFCVTRKNHTENLCVVYRIIPTRLPNRNQGFLR